jgi:predicted permease
MQLAQLNIEKNAAPFAWTAALRLVIVTIAAVILTDFLGIEGVARQVSIIQWGVPTAVTTVVLASQNDCRSRVVAGAIFITALCSFVTIPMLLIWLLP